MQIINVNYHPLSKCLKERFIPNTIAELLKYMSPKTILRCGLHFCIGKSAVFHNHKVGSRMSCAVTEKNNKKWNYANIQIERKAME